MQSLTLVGVCHVVIWGCTAGCDKCKVKYPDTVNTSQLDDSHNESNPYIPVLFAAKEDIRLRCHDATSKTCQCFQLFFICGSLACSASRVAISFNHLAKSRFSVLRAKS